MLHLTSSGRIEPCEASVRSCPLAPFEEHFRTVREASRALALEALERQIDFTLAPLPEGWGSITRNYHLDEILRAEERPQSSKPIGPELTADAFKAFAVSDSAKRPAEDRGDWRGELEMRADSNGDLWSDQNPDTSVSGYWDSTPDDDDDDWGFEEDDAGSLFGTVGSLIGVILLIGLALALFNRFDGDVLSILTWAGNGVFGFISWIAKVLSDNTFFQELVT